MHENTTTARVMKKKSPYVTFDATPFRDTRLSWKAKGLMTYFLDKKGDWEFNLEHIYTQAPDKRTAVASGLQELKKYGYIVRVAYRVGNRVSHYGFLVYEQPVAFPTEKDLHIDLHLWEKYLEDNAASDEPVDVTLFAKYIKSLSRAELKKLKESLDIPQVAGNLKPQKPQENQQVSGNLIPQNHEEAENLKPEKNQENQQVSGFLQAGNQRLTTNKQDSVVVKEPRNILIPEEDILLIKEEWQARFEEVLTDAKFLQLKKACWSGFQKIGFTDATGEAYAMRILQVMENIDKYNRPFKKGALACAKSALADNWEWGENNEFIPHQYVKPPKDFTPFDWVNKRAKAEV